MGFFDLSCAHIQSFWVTERHLNASGTCLVIERGVCCFCTLSSFGTALRFATASILSFETLRSRLCKAFLRKALCLRRCAGYPNARGRFVRLVHWLLCRPKTARSAG